MSEFIHCLFIRLGTILCARHILIYKSCNKATVAGIVQLRLSWGLSRREDRLQLSRGSNLFYFWWNRTLNYAFSFKSNHHIQGRFFWTKFLTWQENLITALFHIKNFIVFFCANFCPYLGFLEQFWVKISIPKLL